MIYSEKFRERMVRRMVGPDAVSATALAKEVGVPQPTLSKWLRATLDRVRDEQKGAEPRPAPRRERTPQEKAALVVQAAALEGEALGAFLRSNGLHEADLAELRRWLDERLDPKETRREREAAKKARQADQKRIRELERELRKKDKALAEAAALLVLKKKLAHLWEDEDDDTPPRSGG